MPITRDTPLTFAEVARIAGGEALILAPATRQRLVHARSIVDAVVARGIPAYGINTGVGALVDTAIDAGALATLSRNLLMSHACALGEPLPGEWVRAILAAQINNFAHGASGIAPATVVLMLGLLEADCLPVVPRQGSVGYLAHMAHIALVLIGEGEAVYAGKRMSGAAALAGAGLAPVVLGAKEGLSLINGSPCATGLGSVALARAARLVEVADAVAAMSCVALGANPAAFAEAAMALRVCRGLARSARNLRGWLADGAEAPPGAQLQDALSLRAIPHVHGAVRVALAHAAGQVDDELASVTDNPAVLGTPQAPRAVSQAHAVAPALALVENAERIAGIELVAAAQALDLATGATLPPGVARLHAAVRDSVPLYADDRPLAPLLEEGARQVRAGLPVGPIRFFD